MKTVCKKLLCLTLVAMMLVSAVPFQAFATEGETTAATTEAVVETTAAAVETTAAATEPAALAETTAPVVETTVPETTVPETTVPETTVPETTVPETTVPETTVPETTVPETTVPETTVPETTVPETTKATEPKKETGSGSSSNKNNTGNSNSGNKTNEKTVTVHLFLDGGDLSVDNNHTVVIGKTYGYLKSLPTPTRTCYDFAGWYLYNTGTRVKDSTKVKSDEMLIAKWTKKEYTVTFQKYDPNAGTAADGWVQVDKYTKDYTAFSTISGSNFPNDNGIKNYFALSGYKIVGWIIVDSGETFEPGVTQITRPIKIRPRYQREVTLIASNPVTNVSWSTKTITVEIGKRFGAVEGTLPNPGPRDSYTFKGWNVGDKLISVANLSNTSSQPRYYPSLGTKFYAEYEASMTVYLYIHTNGNTQTATKIVPYYSAPAEGEFDMTLINMYSIFSSYGDFDDDNDVAYGWYTPEQWERYCTNKAADSAMHYEDIQEKGYGEFHIMLINNGGSSSSSNTNNYNTNTSTADKSNPTTGDTIMMAVTVLAISGAALVALFFLKKRKAAK